MLKTISNLSYILRRIFDSVTETNSILLENRLKIWGNHLTQYILCENNIGGN